MPDPRWFECPVIIPYMGGKFELSKRLIPMIPKHDRYIEPFVGGGSMFFRKRKVDINIINDKHNDLVNLYLSVMTCYDAFASACEALLKSRTLYDGFKNELKTEIIYTDMPDPIRASKYYYIIKNAFNNNYKTPIAKENDWNKEMYLCLKKSKKKLENTMIENKDFRELFEKYPTRTCDFWYFDPPYVIAGERGDYYIHSLDNKDHIDLYNMANQIDKHGGKFMISYDDHDLINDLYKNYEILKIPIQYAGQTTGDDYKNELVITNYKPIVQLTMGLESI